MSIELTLALPKSRGNYRGSVLPQIAAVRSRGGAVLTFRGDDSRTVWLTALGIVAGVGGFGFVWVFFEGVPFWVGLVFVALVLWQSCAAFVRSSWSAAFFGGAELRVDRWPLRLGEAVTIRFSRRLKANLGFTTEATVDCIERVVIGDQDSRSVKEHRCFAIKLDPAAVRRTGRMAVAEWTFTIPPGRPPSFAVSDNAIIWSVNVTFCSNEFMTAPATFELLVLPEVVR